MVLFESDILCWECKNNFVKEYIDIDKEKNHVFEISQRGLAIVINQTAETITVESILADAESFYAALHADEIEAQETAIKAQQEKEAQENANAEKAVENIKF